MVEHLKVQFTYWVGGLPVLNLGLRRAFKLQNMIHRKRVPEEWESSSSLSSLEAETAADALVEALPVPAYTVLFEPT